MNIEFTRLAEEDLVNIKSYLQQARNEDFAGQVLDGIFAAISTLAEQPAAKGKVVRELYDFNMAHYRELIHVDYRIIFELSDTAVYIHVICHHKRDLMMLLKDRIFSNQ